MLELRLNGVVADVKTFKFPAGESGVSFNKLPVNFRLIKPYAHITLCWQGNDDLIELAFLVDALRRAHNHNIDLTLAIPYFPYARQDRVCNEGESFSLKVVADFINSLNFLTVHVTDPHSDVLCGVLDKLVVRPILANLALAVSMSEACTLISPDAGANKKVLGYAKYLNSNNFDVGVIRADKTRDTKTGAITGTEVYTKHLGHRNVLVIDDILDGGGTFIPLAKKLREVTHGTVNLMVTHGIFTKGVDLFQGLYDNIFVVNNMYGSHPLIKEI